MQPNDLVKVGERSRVMLTLAVNMRGGRGVFLTRVTRHRPANSLLALHMSDTLRILAGFASPLFHVIFCDAAMSLTKSCSFDVFLGLMGNVVSRWRNLSSNNRGRGWLVAVGVKSLHGGRAAPVIDCWLKIIQLTLLKSLHPSHLFLFCLFSWHVPSSF